MLSFGGCSNPVTPEDKAPVVSSFTATPSAPEINEAVSLYAMITAESGLDSAIFSNNRGARDIFVYSGETSVPKSVSRTYSTAGTVLETVTAWSKGLKDVKTVSVPVGDHIQFSKTSFSTVEDKAGSVAVKDIVPAGVALSVSNVPAQAHVSIVNDSLKYYCDPDVNGSFPFTLTGMYKGNTKQVAATLDVTPTDLIAGVISDKLKVLELFGSHNGLQ